jgi:hypothetical protein
MTAEVQCGYCGDPLETEAALDDHLSVCEKRPRWVPRIGLEREGWDTPPDAA